MAKEKEKSKKEVLDILKEDKDIRKSVAFGLDAQIPYYVHSGHYGLNHVISGLWHGGWPGGRVCELYGDPSTGKSLLLLAAMVSIQKNAIFLVPEQGYAAEDGYLVLDDTEGAYLEEFCIRQGLDIDDVLQMKTPDSGIKTVEGHFEEMEALVRKIREFSKKTPLAIFLDSISQLSTKHEVENPMEKKDMSKAGQVHKAMRKYSSLIADSGVLYLTASHVIQNIGALFGPQKVVKGGMGVAFQSSVRISLTYKTRFVRNKMKTEEGGDRGEVYGVRIIADAPKNKVNVPMQFTVVDVYYDQGIDPYSGLMDYFIRRGALTVVKKATGGKNPQPEMWGFKDFTGEFAKEEFEKFVIANDVLGVKKAGLEYAKPINKGGDFQEEAIAADSPESVEAPIAPPPAAAPQRVAKE